MLKVSGALPAIVAIAAVYLAFLTRTYYWDGVLFSIYIENAARGAMPLAGLVHPNHLLYTVLGFVLYSAALALHINARAITVLQVLDVAASAAAAWVVYRFARQLIRSEAFATFCLLLFAAGATWWKFSTDADAYTVAVLCEVLACYFAFREKPNWALAGASQVCGMLIHELVVFTYVPILASVLIRHRVRLVPVYVMATGAIVSSVYLISFSLADHASHPTLLKWMTSYSGASFIGSPTQIFTLYLASYTKLFVGGKLSFVLAYFSVALCLGLVICIGGVIWAAILLRKPRQPGGPAGTADARLLWAWFIPYAIFLALFDPGSTFHKLFLWPPLVLLIGVYASRSPYLRQRALALVVIALALAGWNFAMFIYPHAHASADPVLVMARKINRELPRDAKIYYTAFAPDDWYLQYFAPGRKWLVLPNDAMAVLKQPGPVCLETTALDQVERGLRMRLDLDPARRWDLVNSQHNVRLECLK